MAAITFEYSSVELTKVEAVGHALLKPNEMHGRLRMCRFTFDTGSGAVSDGENIKLCVLPKGARVLEIFIAFEAMGGSAAVDIGLAGKDGNGFIDDTKGSTVDDDDDLFAAAISVVSAGEAIVADTIAQNYGYETLKEVYLVATAETDDWAANKDFIGHVVYVLD